MTGSGFNIHLDKVILAGAKRGDMRACEKIYRQYHSNAYTLAVRICNCPELAREVTQEAFITAFRRIAQFRGEAPFWGWLRRVVINHAISSLRKLPRHAAVEFEEHMAHTRGDQEALGRAMDLSRALAQLSEHDRLVVWLHDVEGYKHREIAHWVGKSESYSKTRLKRARARLRQLISGHDQNDRRAPDPCELNSGATRNATA